MLIEDNKFTWGEEVKVNNLAPSTFNPGEVVSICGVTKIDTKLLANKYDSKIGEWFYTIEYLGGSDIEIPERYLESYLEKYQDD